MPPSARRFRVGAHGANVSHRNFELALQRPELIPSLDFETHAVALYHDANHDGPRLIWSLAGKRLPKFYLVSFRIDDPCKLPIFGIVDLLENVATFFAQGFDQSVEILHPVVDHERRGA